MNVLCDYWTSAPIREATDSEVTASRSQPENAQEIIVVDGHACITLDARFCRRAVRVPRRALESPNRRSVLVP